MNLSGCQWIPKHICTLNVISNLNGANHCFLNLTAVYCAQGHTFAVLKVIPPNNIKKW